MIMAGGENDWICIIINTQKVHFLCALNFCITLPITFRKMLLFYKQNVEKEYSLCNFLVAFYQKYRNEPLYNGVKCF